MIGRHRSGCPRLLRHRWAGRRRRLELRGAGGRLLGERARVRAKEAPEALEALEAAAAEVPRLEAGMLWLLEEAVGTKRARDVRRWA